MIDNGKNVDMDQIDCFYSGANLGLHEPLKSLKNWLMARFGVGHEQAMAAFSGLLGRGSGKVSLRCNFILFGRNY